MGINSFDVLADVTWEEVTTKVHGLYDIGELVCHLDYYTAGLIMVMNGGPLVFSDRFSFDAPELVAVSQWQERRSRLIDNIHTFKA